MNQTQNILKGRKENKMIKIIEKKNEEIEAVSIISDDIKKALTEEEEHYLEDVRKMTEKMRAAYLGKKEVRTLDED
jgi:hypothetical protein